MARFIGRAFAVLSPLVLAGCLGDINGTVPAAVTRSVMDGQVVVAGPDGYCVDPRATRENRDEAFVLLASCSSVSATPSATAPFAKSLITVTVTRPAQTGEFDASLSGAEAFFRSSDGRSAIAMDGDPSGVSLVSTETTDDMFVLQAELSDNGRAEGLGRNQWRAIFVVNDNLLSASVMSLASSELSAETGMAILQALVRKIRATSPKAG
ncbi:hypothetical protein ACMU_00425 [Actibacterium mucosum KCTC 23349]|uniref:Dihydroxy-acid dehydratase n=1 Tax=Actibacterium mucosum KCTC 23349 TaxID=1454373 RepID=A0A037ZKP0_9RHOB|nr:hypothetical protein ACMU_00425 [Actibacterium mucosum KCTC 23349]